MSKRTPYVEFGPVIPRKEEKLGMYYYHKLYYYTRLLDSEEGQIRAICDDIQMLADILYNEYGLTDVRQNMLEIREGLAAYGELVNSNE